MTAATAVAPVAAPAWMRTAGLTTLVAGLAGAGSAVVIIAWPDQVADDRFSYPFGASAYVVAQLFFAVQHLGLLVGPSALARLAWSGSTRATRAGLVIGVVGMLGLSACEVFALTATHALTDSSTADAVNSSYGVPMTALGLGLVLAGLGLARRPAIPGSSRWVVLALGIYVFVPMFPAVFGPLVLGRIAIGGWMLLFAVLGRGLLRLDAGGERT